ncbi:NAD(P)-dependent oxidoreductase [Paractinoplanes hotanensis]|uniref:DUF1932 domain-containing protein n=1 Tax=Paractinoplanes hotanensis TaxID=2906497 RepID=A0ABT0XX96_9ACTN|nr:NAD(P)-dependent oxidoreductase [Actinoplanes hotanensis]MCM4078415.1 DUF1932 domain-containing protein [Actinoplanes hotanensis]
MVIVGLVSAGFMGSGLGAALRQGGARVVTTVEGRSARTGRLAAEAGLELLPSLAEVVAMADIVLSVTPPGAAVATAEAVAAALPVRDATRRGLIVADLNAVSPQTMDRVARALTGAPPTSAPTGGRRPDRPISEPPSGRTLDRSMSEPSGARTIDRSISESPSGRMLDRPVAELPGGRMVDRSTSEPPAASALTGVRVVDGSISGPPPSVRPGARLYLSGVDAAAVAELPWGGKVEPIVLDDQVGSASALKMCTGGVYKGLTALVTQALRTADAHGVLDAVLADLDRNGLADSSGVARSATKAGRFVDEMREVAVTQQAAGLAPELYAAIADVYADIARTELAKADPEDERNLTPAEIVAGLRG